MEKKIYPSVISNYGALFLASTTSNNPPTQSSNNMLAWRNATTITVSPNTFYLMNTFVPQTGRALVIYEIEVEVTKACTVTMSHEVTDAPRDGTTAIQLATMFATLQKTTTSAGTLNFKFDIPLIIKTGERLNVIYSVADTTSTNWQITIPKGYDVTDDFDFDSDANIVVFGDSLMITSEYKSVLYEETSTTEGFFGITPFILKNQLAKNLNKSYRIISLCQQGANASQLEDLVRRGRLDNIIGDYLLLVVGMNDCTTNNGLSVSVSTDGYFKTAIKNIIKKWSVVNKNKPIILCTIPTTDDSTRNAIISVSTGQAGYPYNTNKRINAYNTEIRAVSTEMSNYNVILADIAAAYTTSESAFSDLSPKVHMNSTLGHPRVSKIIYNSIINNL